MRTVLAAIAVVVLLAGVGVLVAVRDLDLDGGGSGPSTAEWATGRLGSQTATVLLGSVVVTKDMDTVPFLNSHRLRYTVEYRVDGELFRLSLIGEKGENCFFTSRLGDPLPLECYEP